MFCKAEEPAQPGSDGPFYLHGFAGLPEYCRQRDAEPQRILRLVPEEDLSLPSLDQRQTLLEETAKVALIFADQSLGSRRAVKYNGLKCSLFRSNDTSSAAAD